MKKHFSLPLGAVVTLIMLTAPAHADNLYVSGNIGSTLSNNLNIKGSSGNPVAQQPLKAGINIEGAIGKRFDNFRVEGEVAYQPQKLALQAFNGNVHIVSFLVNGYYDFSKEEIQPYITAGIGVGWQTNDLYPGGQWISGRLQKLAYQLGAGVAVPIGNNIWLDARYRYFTTTSITENTFTYTPSTNSFLLGLRVGI